MPEEFKDNYTQAEALPLMEEEAAAAVEAIPDFPGFSGRGWRASTSDVNNEFKDGYTDLEISYMFDREVGHTQPVREELGKLLRDHWEERGYEIHGEKSQEDDRFGTTDYSVMATRSDGINLWFRVLDRVSLKISYRGAKESEPGEVPYIAPVGGIDPGGEKDVVDDFFPDGIPEDQANRAPVRDPFAEEDVDYEGTL
ncbi:hypothetical protein [Salininema proteolyticum]|uniref:Uncharacterized protein n=1 Tax=Salininema proteolyticum TaxID=1607685 RepID=A0ABV8TUC6_9ACTN